MTDVILQSSYLYVNWYSLKLNGFSVENSFIGHSFEWIYYIVFLVKNKVHKNFVETLEDIVKYL